MPPGNQGAGGRVSAMRVTILVAAAKNGVIGKDGGLPWHLSGDLKRFKARTLGHPVIMGRKTYASIGKPLPGRTNVVVTRDTTFAAPGVEVAHAPAHALELARRAPGGDECFVIGGAEIYAALLPSTHRIELTLVELDVDGDTSFTLPAAGWREVDREPERTDERTGVRWSVRVLERA